MTTIELLERTKAAWGSIRSASAEEKDQLLEEYAIVKLSPTQLAELDRSAVAGVKQGPYGAEALVKRNQIPAAFVTEHTTLEDIILFLAKTQTEMQ